MILDWYHLVKKLRSMMSMIAWDKEDKATRLKFIIPKLWLGKTDAVLMYLKKEVTPRREDKWQELIRYIEKHQSEIITTTAEVAQGKSLAVVAWKRGWTLPSAGGRKRRE